VATDPLGFAAYASPPTSPYFLPTKPASSAPTIPQKAALGPFHLAQVNDAINAAAKKHGIDPKMLRAVALQESDMGRALDENGLGDGGRGHGIFQLDPSSGVSKYVLQRAASDAHFAADYAAGMLANGLKKHGTWQRALSAYNTGSPDKQGAMATVDGQRLPYAQAVLRRYSSLGGSLQAPAQVAVKPRSRLAKMDRRVASDPLGFSKFATPQATPGPTPTAAPTPTPTQDYPVDPTSYAQAGALNPAIAKVVTGPMIAAGTQLGNILDLLNRPHEAVTAAITGGPGKILPTLMHGQSQESQDATRAELRQILGLNYDKQTLPNGVVVPGGYQDKPHWVQGMTDFFLDTLLDPATALGGTGILRSALERLGVKGTAASYRAIEAMQKSANPLIKKAGLAAAAAHDAATFKGPARRAITQLPTNAHGMTGGEQFDALTSINNARKTKEADLSRALIEKYRDSIQGLSENDESKLYDAIHKGTVDALPADLKPRAAAFKQVMDSLAHFEGDQEFRNQMLGVMSNRKLKNVYKKYYRGHADLEHPTGVPIKDSPEGPIVSRARALGDEHFGNPVSFDEFRKQMEAKALQLPPELARFEPGEFGPRQLQDIEQYRPNYVPVQHAPKTLAGDTSIEALDPGEPLESILNAPKQNAPKVGEGIDPEDLNLRRRGEDVPLPKDPNLTQKVIENRLKGGARAIAATDAEREAAQIFGKGSFAKVPKAAREYFRETYTNPEDKNALQHIGDAVKGAVDIPKVGLFALPFRHMLNIANLALLSEPGQVPSALGRYARLMLASVPEEKLAKALGPKVGARLKASLAKLGPNETERRAQVIGDSIKYGVTGTPANDKNLAGWMGRIPGVGDVYRASSHALWSFDDSAKAAQFDGLRKRFLAQGMSPLRAAHKAAAQTRAALIDYGNSSPLTKALSYIFPFASYRTKMPGAVLRATIQHPERVLAASRINATQAGEAQPAGQGKVTKSSLPLAETLRGVDDPAAYFRSALGYPGQMALDAGLGQVSNAEGKGPDNFFTYGRGPTPGYALNSIVGSFPGGDQLLSAVGLNAFPAKGYLQDVGRSQSGQSVVTGPSARQQMALAHIKALDQAIEEAGRSGDKRRVAALQDAKKQYLRYNSIYVK